MSQKRLKAGPAVTRIKELRDEISALLDTVKTAEDGSHTMRTHDYRRFQELVAEMKKLKGESP